MTDRQTVEQLFIARHPLVTVQTFEEEYVLVLLRELAVELQCEFWTWSATDGIREGLLSGSVPIPDTDHAAAALYWLSRENRRQGIYVFLDARRISQGRPDASLPAEATDHLAEGGSQIVLLDQCDALPPVVEARAARFTPSLPDEEEIQDIIRSTFAVSMRNDGSRCISVVTICKPSVRNLQGLTRRQARQVILDSVCPIADSMRVISTVSSQKRQAVAGDGILDYVESPVNQDEIGGLTRLKAWLKQRQNCMSDEAVAFGITQAAPEF